MQVVSPQQAEASLDAATASTQSLINQHLNAGSRYFTLSYPLGQGINQHQLAHLVAKYENAGWSVHTEHCLENPYVRPYVRFSFEVGGRAPARY